MPEHAHRCLSNANFVDHLLARLEEFASKNRHSASWPTYEPLIRQRIQEHLLPLMAEVICEDDEKFRELVERGKPYHSQDPITTKDPKLQPVITLAIEQTMAAINPNSRKDLWRKKKVNCLILLGNFQKQIRFT